MSLEVLSEIYLLLHAEREYYTGLTVSFWNRELSWSQGSCKGIGSRYHQEHASGFTRIKKVNVSLIYECYDSSELTRVCGKRKGSLEIRSLYYLLPIVLIKHHDQGNL